MLQLLLGKACHASWTQSSHQGPDTDDICLVDVQSERDKEASA